MNKNERINMLKKKIHNLYSTERQKYNIDNV